ncbi:Fe2+-dicitrate sensor protein [Herminiimonas sp. KBW02]|uniref:FecR domain-containing protein n=1 Tax=Herminiimonas sp. KBW02 TaxID=2153363 RepID=UPI000F5B7EEC|nr:FecR family protein [Herminiimonas sp. KBW02]RQO36541.1 Fe2+-dicitrate sensor protein [Herminiimonas sp. KBW02]
MHIRTLFSPHAEHDDTNDTVIDSTIVKQAIVWLVTLQSGTASPSDRRACAAWREADSRHEQAWQRLHTLGQDLRSGGDYLAPPVLRSVLRNSARSNRRVILKSLFGLALLGGTAAVVRKQPAWQTAMAGHQTSTGEQRKIVLADGTRIMLNTATAIDVSFNDELRQVILHRGEIMIETAQDDAGRPFELVTGNGHIRPIGTRFTVRYNERPSTTAVAVLEGAVNITPGDGSSQRVNAGEQTHFTDITALTPFALDNSSVAWTDGVLVVERMRLADFITELDRYRPGILRCDPAVADLLVSGSYPLQDPDGVLALLEETLPLQVRSITRYWITIVASPQT